MIKSIIEFIKKLKFKWKESKDLKLLERNEITREGFYKRQPQFKSPFPIFIPPKSSVELEICGVISGNKIISTNIKKIKETKLRD